MKHIYKRFQVSGRLNHITPFDNNLFLNLKLYRLIFLQNLTITRLPAVGICSIKPLDKSISPPKKMKTDMSYVSD